jgi:hypothetical protein
MGTIGRVPPDLPQTREQQSTQRNDVYRGAANVSPEIEDQNREMEKGNVTAPKKVAEEIHTSATDIRQEESHQTRQRGRRLDRHA